MERIRAWIEGFLRGRYGLPLPPLAVPVLIGAILVVGWLLAGPSLTIPRFTTEGPVVRNGVAVIVACGNKSGLQRMGAAMKYAPEPGTGGWWNVPRGDCTVWYHRPPLPEQRQNRQERAANLSVSGEMLPPEGVRRSQDEIQTLPVVERLPEAFERGPRLTQGV